MRSFVALTLVLLSTSASSLAVITIPLTRPQRTGSYLKGSPDADRARAAFLNRHTGNRPLNVPVVNLAYVQYTTSIGIGNPPTYYNLAVDTGSSNTAGEWLLDPNYPTYNYCCSTGIPYVRTSTSIPTGEAVNVTYGVGYFSGKEYLDQVTLGPNLVITNQSIGDALSSESFEGVDGLIGVGPVDLTGGTLFPETNRTIPTVMNNLVSQKLIENQVLGVYFSPATSDNDPNGVLTYGGIDSRLYDGEVTYVPVTKTHPASMFWGINVTSSTYGDHTIIPKFTAGIVDTGTTLVLLADDFFSVYLRAIPGAKLDSVTGLIEIPLSSVSSMKPLDFTIADRVFTMDVAAQLVPRDQNTAWGGVVGKQYGVVSNLGSNSREGFDFILGEKFMERYYAVFDADTNRVGFAQTNHTLTTCQV